MAHLREGVTQDLCLPLQSQALVLQGCDRIGGLQRLFLKFPQTFLQLLLESLQRVFDHFLL